MLDPLGREIWRRKQRAGFFHSLQYARRLLTPPERLADHCKWELLRQRGVGGRCCEQRWRVCELVRERNISGSAWDGYSITPPVSWRGLRGAPRRWGGVTVNRRLIAIRRRRDDDDTIRFVPPTTASHGNVLMGAREGCCQSHRLVFRRNSLCDGRSRRRGGLGRYGQ